MNSRSIFADRIPSHHTDVNLLAQAIRDLPFIFPLDRSVSFLVRHEMGSCTAKHLLLSQWLNKLEIPNRIVYLMVKYDRRRLRFHEIDPHLYHAEYPHTAIEIWIDGYWQMVDISFDRFIHQWAPVNPLDDTDFTIGEILAKEIHTRDDWSRSQHLGCKSFDCQNNLKRQASKKLHKDLYEVRRPHLAQMHQDIKRFREIHRALS